jgi:two-component system response regulator RegX3
MQNQQLAGPDVESGSQRSRVLVVEDDESHVLALLVGLEREGFDTSAITTGSAALQAILDDPPDVVLLDVMLPDISGIDICRHMRQVGSTVPVVIVSVRSDELEVVVGMEVGADDYVTKPYRMRELVARIRAVLRRGAPAAMRIAAQTPRVERNDVLEVGDVRLDVARHEVHVRGELVELTLREFKLLEELLRNPRLVLTRDTLIERVWGYDYDGDPRIVSTLVGRLRGRIELDPERPERIVTIRGLGYRYDPPRQRPAPGDGERAEPPGAPLRRFVVPGRREGPRRPA